jgi:hypothetical protein
MAVSSTSGTTPKLDIVRFASDIMSEVEGIRSYVAFFNGETQLTEQLPTESRVNAFFRLIGLPMFVSITPQNGKDSTGGSNTMEKVTTPGYRKGGLPQGIIANSDGVQLSGPDGRDASAKSLLDLRERRLLEREQQIGTNDSNARRAEAFYRPMGLALNQDTSVNGHEVFKRISPFAVSYMEILPEQNELSKPFLANPEDGRPPPPTTPIKRPFIETVIRIRMVSLDGGNQGQTDYLSATRERVALLSQEAADMIPQDASSMETFIIDQMLGAIDQFADRWVMLQTRRERLLKNVKVVLKPKTVSARRSAFGKQGNLALEMDLPGDSAVSQRLAALQRGIAVSEAMVGLLPTADNTSLTGETVKNVMPNALTNTFVSVLRQPLEQQQEKLSELNTRIATLSQQADKLRLELELLTGEFSGLSLPDVVFTILGMFLIDRNDLVSMLDSDTKDEMGFDPVLNAVLKKFPGDDPLGAVVHLENAVTDLYNTLDAAIDVRMRRDKRTGKGSASIPTISAGAPPETAAIDLINSTIDKDIGAAGSVRGTG